ncbi:MAG TPA: hypothetical protein VMI30_14100 [Stellaceae bacterium]|nr:hypothetical protein [Stellaceae bacterium]
MSERKQHELRDHDGNLVAVIDVVDLGLPGAGMVEIAVDAPSTS